MASPKKEALLEEIESLKQELLALQDQHDDLLNGIRIWERAKGIEGWTDEDEILIRWMSYYG